MTSMPLMDTGRSPSDIEPKTMSVTCEMQVIRPLRRRYASLLVTARLRSRDARFLIPLSSVSARMMSKM